MPKYAVLSDIHGNLEAFEAVLNICSIENVEKFLLLGDIVGYNANPAECIALARSLNLIAKVRGDHDDYAIRGNTETSGFNINARIAIQWTHDQLSEDDIKWLDNLPYKKIINECNATIVHATLDTPENWGYIFDVQYAADHFTYQFKQVCFCGHTHVPVAFDKIPFATSERRIVERIPAWEGEIIDEDTEIDFSIADKITIHLEKGHKYLFNIGSIGQPSHNDPRASFAIYDSDAQTVTRYRVPYDIATARQKVLQAGLPAISPDDICNYFSLNDIISFDPCGNESVECPKCPATIARHGMIIGILLSIFAALLLPSGTAARGASTFFGVCAAAFLPVYIMTIYWKRTTVAGVWAGMIAGTLSSVFQLLFLHQKDASLFWRAVNSWVYSLPFLIIVLIVVSLQTAPPPPGGTSD